MYRLEQIQNALFEEGMHLKIDVHRISSVYHAMELIRNMSAKDPDIPKRIMLDLPTQDAEEILVNMVGPRCYVKI